MIRRGILAVSALLFALGTAQAGEPVTSQYILGQLVPITGEEETRSIDLDVRFEVNSAKLTAEAQALLRELGGALIAPELKDALFAINGHTDASGSAAYNKTLSQKRADSVKAFLVKEFDIDPKRLEAVGWGEERLKNTADPKAAENRRVEIVNLTPLPPKKTAPPPPVVVQPQSIPVQPSSQPVAPAPMPTSPMPEGGGMQSIN